MANRPEWVPVSGPAASRAGATIAITCQKLIIGSAGQIMSNGEDIFPPD